MNNDPLFFLKEPTLSATVKQAALGTSAAPTINPVHFILNIIFVLIILYLTILLLKLFYKKTATPNSYVLKEVQVNAALKVLYVKINKKLYLLAQTSNQLLLLDTLSSQKEILQALTENEEIKPVKPSWFSWLKLPVKSGSASPEFHETLKTIIKNSEDLEGLNKK